MRWRLVTLAAVAALPLVAACEPPFAAQMAELDRLVHRTSYDAWLALAADGAARGRRLHPWLDWSTDGCSAPLLGAGPFDFTVACARHDLAWRNLRRLSVHFGRPAWNAANKLEADRRFHADLRTRCARHPLVIGVACLATAQVYATAVALVPPRSAPWVRATGGFRW